MKRQKMYLGDMLDAGIEYIDFQRVTNKKTGVKGWRYVLEKPLTEKQVAIINSFKNTVISSCQYRYAPEIKHDTLIILDKVVIA